MELHLKLRIVRGNLLPINYQYEVASWIYNVIGTTDGHYSTFLHERGFQTAGRSFKMFTFSQLDVRPYTIQGDAIHLLGDSISLTIRFLVDQSLDSFIKGLFLNQEFFLGNKIKIHFRVTEILTMPAPAFKSLMQYTCLSPICVSMLRSNGTAEYVSPESKSFGELLIANLVRKEKAFAKISNVGVTETIEQPTLPTFKFQLLNTPRKKGVHIKTNTAQHTQLIGYLFHFELLAPPALHEIGYLAGFGEKNSMGFGCVDATSATRI